MVNFNAILLGRWGTPWGTQQGCPHQGTPHWAPLDKILHVFQVRTTHELIRGAPLEGLPTADGVPGGGTPGGVPHK